MLEEPPSLRCVLCEAVIFFRDGRWSRESLLWHFFRFLKNIFFFFCCDLLQVQWKFLHYLLFFKILKYILIFSAKRGLRDTCLGNMRWRLWILLFLFLFFYYVTKIWIFHLIFCFSSKGWEEEYELSLGHALHQGHGADGAFSLLTNLNFKQYFCEIKTITWEHCRCGWRPCKRG